MEVKSRIGFNQLIFGIVFILAVFLAYRIILNPDSQFFLLIGGILAAIFIVLRPILGLAAYLLIYPMVPAEESLTLLKISVFGLFILILSIWLIKKSFYKERFVSTEYRWMFLFFIFLCISPLLGSVNNFTPIDWARDIAPLLNLLLIPIMVDYFKKRQNDWLLYLVFLLMVLSMIKDIIVLFSGYGVTFIDLAIFESVPLASIHPSLGFGLGLIMFIYKAPHKRLWLILAVISLVVTFLTPTRTVWLTTGTMALLILAFSSRRRVWALTSIVITVGLIGWLFLHSGSSSYIESQSVRFQKLVEYHYDLSFENRVEEIKQTGELFLSSPLYGVGFGYRYRFWRPFVTGIGPGILDTTFTHNDIMFIVSKGGLIGLVLFGLMLYGLGKKLFQRRKEKPNSLQSAWATIGLIALVNSIVIGLSTPVIQTRGIIFVLAILLAMGLAYGETGSDARQS